MNEPESILIGKELDQYLGGVSLETLKEATFEAIGIKHYSADSDFIWMSQRIGAMETAALLGDMDAIRYLHHIATLATDALSRTTSPLRSSISQQLESSDITDGGELDFGVIASSAARLGNLDGLSLAELHRRTLAEEREEGLHPDQPFLPLSTALFPDSEAPTASQYSASEILSSIIRKHLSRKIRPGIRQFIGKCTAWPGKYFVGYAQRVTESANFAMPTGLGRRYPQSDRARSPDSRSAFAYSVFVALYERRSSPRPHATYEKLIYGDEMKKLERYLLEMHRGKKSGSKNPVNIPKPGAFEYLLEQRWQWDAEELPELTRADYVIGRWVVAATKWVDSFTKGDVSNIFWPDYITHRRGVVGNPTMSTIREMLKEQFKKIARLLSEQASVIAEDPNLLSKRHQDFNTRFLAKTRAGGRAVADALKIGGNSHALVQSLEKLAIPQIQGELMKSKPVAKKSAAKKTSKKKGKS